MPTLSGEKNKNENAVSTFAGREDVLEQTYELVGSRDPVAAAANLVSFVDRLWRRQEKPPQVDEVDAKSVSRERGCCPGIAETKSLSTQEARHRRGCRLSRPRKVHPR